MDIATRVKFVARRSIRLARRVLILFAYQPIEFLNLPCPKGRGFLTGLHMANLLVGCSGPDE